MNDERNQNKYHEYFEIIGAGKAFNHEKVKNGEDKNKNKILLASSRSLSLWQCQLSCINNADCKSMSYCANSKECILTTLSTEKDISSKYLVENSQCSTSVGKKNYLKSSNNFYEPYFKFLFQKK